MKQLLLVVALITVGFSYSQNCSYTLLGEVKDFHDGEPIVQASIFIKTENRYITSDAEGKFKIENLCAKELLLVISHIACDTKTIRITIKGDTYKVIRLEHHVEELNEVSITGSSSRKETVTAQETTISEKTLKKYSALNLGDALKEVSGVSSINTGNTIVKPMINGMHSSRLLIVNNGVRQQDQEWGIEHAPNIDINSAGQISVIKGSGALAYGGDAIGGVIVINPSRIVLADSLYGNTILSGQTNGRAFSISSNLNKTYRNGWFVKGQGTYKQNGDFKAPDYYLTNTGSATKAFSVNTGYNTFESGFEVFYSYLNNEIGILRASHIGNIGDLVNAINSQEPLVTEDFSSTINSPKQDVTHHLAKLRYYKRFQSFGKVSVQYDYQNNQRFEFDVRVGDDRNKPALDLTLQTHTLTTDVILDSETDYKFKFGLMGRFQDNFANPETGVRRLIPDYNRYDFGTYLTVDWYVNETTSIDAGVRYDFNRIDAKKFYRTSRWEERGYDEDFGDIIIEDLGTQLLTNPIFDYHNISASTGIKFKLNTQNTFLFNYSLSRRPPNPSELFSDGLHHSAARIELGELRLKQELSNRVGLTYIYNNSDFNATVEGFYNRINDFIYLEPFGIEQTIRGAFPVWNYKQSNAELFGIDVSLNYNATDNLVLANKSAFIRGNDLSDNRPLIDMPAFNTINSVNFFKPEWNDLSITLKSEWVLEQTQFPDNNFEVFIASTNTTELVDISTPPPAYHLLHFYSDMSFDISRKMILNIALSVNNIFNTTYRAYLNRLRYFSDDLGRNVMLQLQLNY
ncbi:TonB-dependent receptor [Winogradskyella sp. UBA3174]|uniref:TonB-dependent receptor n=1 Tax=Winogradskyella sp. UBA3174 TaxID=1947785 RepID=UPI0025DAB7B8|nr:TonB-dependent receptor [Winogradskyella sp. UBA3174]|tara:strand:- start:63066 stop:65465 length:2400 start_codon:yes stop_codon:yes gene_type:complete